METRLRGWLLATCVALPFPSIGQEPPSGTDNTEPTQTYEDQLIDPDVEPQPPLEEMEREVKGLPWLFGIEYRLGLREMDGNDTVEHGFSLEYQRETHNFGDLRFEMVGASTDSDNGFFHEGETGHFTLEQHGMPLSESWLLDSRLGVQRSRSDPLIESSYRFYLPSSILNGISGRARDDDTQWRFTWGRTGRLDGLYTRTFESDHTTLVGGGLSQRLDEDWTAALELWTAQPDDEEFTHNMSGAIGLASDDSPFDSKVQVVVDDDGDSGFWADGSHMGNRWQQRFGIFSLATDLEWQDSPILNNRDGFYYRADYRTLRRTYSFGLDADRTRDNGLYDYRAFAGANWRLGTTSNVGLQVSAGNRDLLALGMEELEEETADDWRINVYYNKEYEWLDQRLELQTLNTRGEPDAEEYRLSLDQFWKARLEGLSTRFEVERREEDPVTTDTWRAGVQYRHRFAGDLSLNSGLLAQVTDSGRFGSNSSGNATLGLYWPVTRSWSVTLNATYTSVESESAFQSSASLETAGTEVFLSIAYGRSGGRPARVLGLGSAESGVGRISGVVFFDENGDGRRSPGEEPAAGVVVRLDGGVTSQTDEQGRYEFWPVAARAHRLSLGVEGIPLPWAPIDPVTVNVTPRGEQIVDLPLQRINE